MSAAQTDGSTSDVYTQVPRRRLAARVELLTPELLIQWHARECIYGLTLRHDARHVCDRQRTSNGNHLDVHEHGCFAFDTEWTLARKSAEVSARFAACSAHLLAQVLH